MDDDAPMSLTEPNSDSPVLYSGVMNEEEYLVDTCMPAVQSCPLSQAAQRALNRNCMYDLFEFSRILRDGTEKLLGTLQAESRNPGTQVYHTVSAPLSQVAGFGPGATYTQLKGKLYGISGPCRWHKRHRGDGHLGNWTFRDSVFLPELRKVENKDEIVYYARSNEVGVEHQVLETFWIPNITPQRYYLTANFCGGASRSVSLNVYPDVQWEVKLIGAFSATEETANDPSSNRNVSAGITLSVKATYGAREHNFSADYQRIIDGFNELVSMVRDVKKLIDDISNDPEASSDQTAVEPRAREGISIDWPEVDTTLTWGWAEHQVEHGVRCQYKYSLSGSITFFKITFAIELLGPLLTLIPGAGPFLSRLQAAGDSTGLLRLTLTASASAELKATIAWHGDVGGTSEIDVTGLLKLEIAVQAELSTRVTTPGVFGWQAEFAAGLQGSATSGITFSAERDLWKSDGGKLEIGFKGTFDGITVRGVAFIEGGLSRTVQEGNSNPRLPSSQSSARNARANQNRGEHDPVIPPDDDRNRSGSERRSGESRESTNVSFVVFEPEEMFSKSIDVNSE